MDWLYQFLGSMLSWFSSIFGGSYVFGLLLYAILFKLLFLPFSIKQQKNQIKMAKLAPKIELIKAKYKGRTDQPTMQKQQQEIMELQQSEGYNPLSGCLPLLLQFPIIIFLYNVIRNPLSHICRISEEGVRGIAKVLLEKGYELGINGLTLENVDTISFASIDQIKLMDPIEKFGRGNFEGVDLSKLPNLDLFGTNLGATPDLKNLSWIVIIPVIAAVLTWLSMYLTRKWNNNPATQAQDAQANASMKMMDLMMPGMTLFMAFGLSAMMGVYWIYQSALGILQTFLIAKLMPLPKFSEEEIKDMKKAQKEAEKNARTAAKNAPKYRSLHYIDDDDYEELPELNNDGNGAKPNGSIDLPDLKD